MTVIPLFCARFLKRVNSELEGERQTGGFNARFNTGFQKLLDVYENAVRGALRFPIVTILALSGLFLGSLALYPLLGVAFFPRTDAGQFTISMKVPTGERIENSEAYVGKVESLIRSIVKPSELKMIVSNIGIVPDFSALYSNNAGPYTATIQVELTNSHKTGSFEYMDRVRRAVTSQYPDIRTFFSSGSMVDAILNMGAPAPIDVQVSSRELDRTYNVAQELAAKIRKLSGVGEVYVPQDMNYPAVRLNIDRTHAAELGLSQKEIVDNVITALNSNTMIAPNYWVDHKTGNDYFLTVQYYEHGKSAIHSFVDLNQIPLRGSSVPSGPSAFSPAGGQQSKTPVTVLGNVASLEFVQSPTEIDHYQIQRVADVYVTPFGEDLGTVSTQITRLLKEQKFPGSVRINLRGMVEQMNDSFKSFAIGLGLSVVLLFLILVAQFRSFKDPFLIMLAIPMGFIGVMVVLPLTHTTLNVMSLMGVLMLVGISASNSILIVEFAHRLEEQGKSVQDAIITSCRVRLRPILMTSLATIIGMVPMALKLGTGSEQYAPLARVIIGGLTVSVLFTVFIVPAAFLLVYGRKPQPSFA
jgi:multidrug efflux pump subunit AcrB